MSFLPSLKNTEEVFSSWTTRDRVQKETWHEAEKMKEEQTRSAQTPSSERPSSTTRPLSSKLASTRGSEEETVDENSKKQLIDEWYRHYVQDFSRPRRTDDFLNEFGNAKGRYHQLRDSKFHQWVRDAKSKDKFFVENAVAEQEYYKKQKEEEKRKLDEMEKREKEEFQRNTQPQDRLYSQWKRKNVLDTLVGKQTAAPKNPRGFLSSKERKTEFGMTDGPKQLSKTPHRPKETKKHASSASSDGSVDNSSVKSSRSIAVPNWLADREEYKKALDEVSTREVQAIKNALRTSVAYRTEDEQDLLTGWLKKQGPPFSEWSATYRSKLSSTIMLRHVSPDALANDELKNDSSEKTDETTSSEDYASLYFVLQGYILVVEGREVDILCPGDSLGDESWYYPLRDGVDRREKRVRSTLTSGIEKARDAIEADAKTFRSKISSIVTRRASLGITPRSERALGGFFGDISHRNEDAPRLPSTLTLKTPLDKEEKYFRIMKHDGNGQRLLFLSAPDLGNHPSSAIAEKLLRLVPSNDLSLRFGLDPRQFNHGHRKDTVVEEIASKLEITERLQTLIKQKAATGLTSSSGIDVGRLHLGDYRRIINIEMSKESRNLASWLHSNIPVLNEVNINKVLSVANAAEVQSFQEGELIYAQDSSADTLCFLREGLAESVCRVSVKFSYRVPCTKAKDGKTRGEKFRTQRLSQIRDVYVKVRRIHERECFGEEVVLSLLPEDIVLQSFLTQASNRKVDLIHDHPDRVYFATGNSLDGKSGTWSSPSMKYIGPFQLEKCVKGNATALKQQSPMSDEDDSKKMRDLQIQDGEGQPSSSLLPQLREQVQQMRSQRQYSTATPVGDPSVVARPHSVIAVRPCEVIFIKRKSLGYLAFHERRVLFKLFRAALLHPSDEELAYEQIFNLNRICEDRQSLVSHLGHRYSSRVYEGDSSGRTLSASPRTTTTDVTDYTRISVASKKQTAQQYASYGPNSSPKVRDFREGQEPLAKGGFVDRRQLTSFPISSHARSNSQYVSAVREAIMSQTSSSADPERSSTAETHGRSEGSVDQISGEHSAVPPLELNKVEQEKDTEVIGPQYVAKAIATDRSHLGSSNTRRATMWDPVYDAEEDDVLYALESKSYSSPRHEGIAMKYFDSDRLQEELECNVSSFHSTADSVMQKLEGTTDKELLQMLSDAASRSPRRIRSFHHGHHSHQ